MAKHRGKVDPARFAMVPRPDVPRSSFDVRYNHKTSMNAGLLVPLYVDEVLPGDSLRAKMTVFARLATPIVPVMDNLYLESFFFFIPNRLVWDNWERFMGERVSPTDTTVFLVPQLPITAADTAIGGMVDYFGITINSTAVNSFNVNALPFRAYNLVWNEWFRDQDLQDPADVSTGDGPDTNVYVLRRRGKRADYFTTCRPWPQKPINAQTFSSASFGGPFVPGGNMTFPQSGAPVTGLGVSVGASPSSGPLNVAMTGARNEEFDPYWTSNTQVFRMKVSPSGQSPDVRVLINDIRTAMAVQNLLERNARGGTRYAELVRSHFGVISPDARLQRPEYLGGGRSVVSINPVAQTSATEDGTVLGELAAIGTIVGTGHGFSASFTEHGWILGLVAIRADLTYQNGTNRMWFRRTQFDHYFPSLAHLGEQAVLSKELFSTGGDGDQDVFGYQERWSEYKYKPSIVSGVFRSSTATPLDMWHLAQNFSSRPVLGENFIVEDPPVPRVLQVATTDGEEFLVDSSFDLRWTRCMPVHSLPGVFSGRL